MSLCKKKSSCYTESSLYVLIKLDENYKIKLR